MGGKRRNVGPNWSMRVREGWERWTNGREGINWMRGGVKGSVRSVSVNARGEMWGWVKEKGWVK